MSASRSSASSQVPFEPSVRINRCTEAPAAAHFASVAPHPNSMSSGCAPIASATSGTGRSWLVIGPFVRSCSPRRAGQGDQVGGKIDVEAEIGVAHHAPGESRRAHQREVAAERSGSVGEREARPPEPRAPASRRLGGTAPGSRSVGRRRRRTAPARRPERGEGRRGRRSRGPVPGRSTKRLPRPRPGRDHQDRPGPRRRVPPPRCARRRRRTPRRPGAARPPRAPARPSVARARRAVRLRECPQAVPCPPRTPGSGSRCPRARVGAGREP